MIHKEIMPRKYNNDESYGFNYKHAIWTEIELIESLDEWGLRQYNWLHCDTQRKYAEKVWFWWKLRGKSLNMLYKENPNPSKLEMDEQKINIVDCTGIHKKKHAEKACLWWWTFKQEVKTRVKTTSFQKKLESKSGLKPIQLENTQTSSKWHEHVDYKGHGGLPNFRASEVKMRFVVKNKNKC